MQVQSVRFTDLRYFVPQLRDAIFDWILHDNTLAEHAERITVARGSGISLRGRSRFCLQLHSCCSLFLMASILTKGTSSGASLPAALPTLTEKLLVPAHSKRPRSRFLP